MKITVIGTGYVGLVTGACLADRGNRVLCLDLDADKIALLNNGGIPIYEPGLQEMVQRNVKANRLAFTSNIEESVAFGDIQFIAVGTPPGEDGSADVGSVLAAAANIARYMTSYRIIVDKSTVPVGTADKVSQLVQSILTERGSDLRFSVVSNPEFLKEGAAIDDFMRPDRIVVGSSDPVAIDKMRSLYQPFQRNHERLVIMDVRSAELTKYAANAMLATRISFMNELANLAETLGADIEQVRRGIGSDPRIGYAFLYAGCGYGGSCFPKDVQALLHTAAQNQAQLRVLTAVEQANNAQKLRLVEKVVTRFGDNLAGKTFALWGLAFKPNTDDMREAPSLTVIRELLQRGAAIQAYDPVAMTEARRLLGDTIAYQQDMYQVLHHADALLIMTEWKMFHTPDFDAMRDAMRNPCIFDGRNLYEPREMAALGFDYQAIGR